MNTLDTTIVEGDLSIDGSLGSQVLTLISSFSGGDDDGGVGHFDSTSKLILQSFQRAGTDGYGQVAHIESYKWDSKQMLAWFIPNSYDGTTGDPIGSLTPKVWIGAHAQSTDQTLNHNHWEIETPDSEGYLRGRFTVDFAATTTQNGTASSNDPASPGIGLDKTIIATNQADFVVRTSYPTFQAGDTTTPTGPSLQSALRLDGPSGIAQDIQFSRDNFGTNRRWAIRNSADAESGSNAGALFQVIGYDDSGTLLGTALQITRSTGAVTIGATSTYKGGLTVNRTTGSSITATNTGIGATAYLATVADTTSRVLAGGVSGDSSQRTVIYADGKQEWGSGSASRDTNLYRKSAGVLSSDYKITATEGIGIGNSANASTLGTLTKKMEVFDASGNSIGFIPIYSSIT